MTSELSLHPDALAETLAQLESRVRGEPANPKHRIFLFQLQVVLGQWDRALKQLSVLENLDHESLPMVGTYRPAIQCEALRAEIFAGRRTPVVFGEPDPWMALLLESLQRLGAGDQREADDLRARAFAEAPATGGKVDESPCAWIADADSRLGPMLEVIINGRYAWVPFQRIARVEIEAPADLRDIVWMPAQFTWANGGELVGLIPTRYPGTDTSGDGQLQLARRTEWAACGEDAFRGLGQRMFATDAGDHPLMDTRLIVLDTVPAGSGDADRESYHA